MDMQTQVSQATSQLIASIHQAMTGPTSAPRSHDNSISIDDQETLSAQLSLIPHLEKLAEIQTQILQRLSQLINPGRQILEAQLGTHKELVQRQIGEEHGGLCFDQEIRASPRLEDSLMLNPPSVDELQHVPTRIQCKRLEHTQVRNKELDYLEGWTITCTEFQPRERKRPKNQVSKEMQKKKDDRAQNQQPPHQVRDHRTCAQTSQVQRGAFAGRISHVVVETIQDDDQVLLGMLSTRFLPQCCLTLEPLILSLLPSSQQGMQYSSVP
jgi:hypothetical protein